MKRKIKFYLTSNQAANLNDINNHYEMEIDDEWSCEETCKIFVISILNKDWVTFKARHTFMTIDDWLNPNNKNKKLKELVPPLKEDEVVDVHEIKEIIKKDENKQKIVKVESLLPDVAVKLAWQEAMKRLDVKDKRIRELTRQLKEAEVRISKLTRENKMASSKNPYLSKEVNLQSRQLKKSEIGISNLTMKTESTTKNLDGFQVKGKKTTSDNLSLSATTKNPSNFSSDEVIEEDKKLSVKKQLLDVTESAGKKFLLAARNGDKSMVVEMLEKYKDRLMILWVHTTKKVPLWVKMTKKKLLFISMLESSHYGRFKLETSYYFPSKL